MTRTTTPRDLRSRFFLAGLAAIALTSTDLTLAKPPEKFDAAPSIKIRYADLDLSKPAGAETLYLRIQRAARMVCRDSISPSDVQRSRTYRKCYEAAVDTAVGHVSAPTLTARHDGIKAKRTASR